MFKILLNLYDFFDFGFFIINLVEFFFVVDILKLFCYDKVK